MTTNPTIRLARAFGIAGPLFLALGVAVPAAAQDTRWMPWLGCWQPTADPMAADVAAAGESYVVCVTTVDGGARFRTVAEGETVAERTVVANGSQRPVEQAGCRGWESARWSSDEQRVYLLSELACEGGTERTTSGVLSMASPEEWIDVQGVAAGDNQAVRVRRYRVASEERIRAAGAIVDVADRALALSTARTVASQELSLQDIREASAQVAAPVVEALLVERQSRIRLDARALVSLADAGVPASVIDLMVAQANPDRFMIDRDIRAGVEVPDDEQHAERERGYPIYAGWGYDPWGYDPFWYGGYGYGRYGYSPYGRGYRDPYSWYYGSGPGIIIVQPDDDDEDSGGGRMVKGRGYVPRSAPSSSGDSSTRSSSGSGSSSGAAASSGSSSGSSGRKAKPRGGRGGSL